MPVLYHLEGVEGWRAMPSVTYLPIPSGRLMRVGWEGGVLGGKFTYYRKVCSVFRLYYSVEGFLPAMLYMLPVSSFIFYLGQCLGALPYTPIRIVLLLGILLGFPVCLLLPLCCLAEPLPAFWVSQPVLMNLCFCATCYFMYRWNLPACMYLYIALIHILHLLEVFPGIPLSLRAGGGR
jgi:hypothetical protein